MSHPLLAALLAFVPAAVPAQDRTDASPPTGLTTSLSLGGGGELGLDSGRAGVFELEASVGWELASVGIRPEIAAVLGVAPDGHVGIRPGVRWNIRGFPVQLRLAVDAANARDTDFRWRWLLIGACAEARLTSLLALYGEIDTGAPLRSEAGLPLLLRGGASFRF